jgi:hypothetical protein
MQLATLPLVFPATFCCNCGDRNCVSEIQDTRVTRYFGFGGTETTFHLPIPICANCRRSTRRRPVGFFGQLLVFAVLVCVWFLALIMLGSMFELPLWFSEHLFGISMGLGFALTFVIFRLRRPKPPQTSFYQPVRIKNVSVRVTDLIAGAGQVEFMKLAFTNPEYLEVFVNANQDAVQTRHLSAVKS